MQRYALIASLAVLCATALANGQQQWYHEGHRRAYPERPEALVKSWYERYLHREPEYPGAQGWVDALRQGQPPEAVLAMILSSEEYYGNAGNSPSGFVQRLFLDIAGRAPTPRELDYWVHRRMSQSERHDVAYALLQRFPGIWETPPAYPDHGRYDYRRPTWPYRHQ